LPSVPVWRTASKLCALRSRERASRCRLRAGRACAGGSAQPGQRTRPAGAAAAGCAALREGLEARTDRSSQKQEEPSGVRATARQISFADWELMRDQGIRLEPLLEAISGFLDDQRDVIERVRQDLVRGLKQPDSGRHGLTATQVLRSLVLMRLKNWDYRELRERIADGLTLRQFTDFYCAPVPKHDAFQRGFVRLTPRTL